MKKFLSLLLVLTLAIVPFTVSSAATFTAGEYEATATGFGGDVTVKVTVAEGKIASVEIVENHETQAVAAGALEKVPQAIVEANSPDVDGVSGATLTSGRIKNAVAECLKQAAK